MADVTVEIAGRQHRLACEDGQEAHLMSLARDLDEQGRQLARQVRDTDETRLMLMLALIMADRARDAEAVAGAVPEATERESAAADRIMDLARRIERVSADLSGD